MAECKVLIYLYEEDKATMLVANISLYWGRIIQGNPIIGS